MICFFLQLLLFHKICTSEQQNCILVKGCFVNFSLLAQINRSCFAASFDSLSKDNCCGVSSQMTVLGWSLNSFAKAVVVLSSSIHNVLSVWLVKLISGMISDRGFLFQWPVLPGQGE